MSIKAAPRVRILFLAAAVAAAVSGCASSAAREACSATCSDAQITQAVRTRLFDDASVPPSHITVSTVDGVVYLHGLVGTSVERSRAVSIARGVPGVARVVDSLELHDSQ